MNCIKVRLINFRNYTMLIRGWMRWRNSWQGSATFRTSPSVIIPVAVLTCTIRRFHATLTSHLRGLSARMSFRKRKGNVVVQVLCTDNGTMTRHCWLPLLYRWVGEEDASGCWWIFCVVGASHFVSAAAGVNWKKIEFTRTQLSQEDVLVQRSSTKLNYYFDYFTDTRAANQTLWLHFAGTYFNLSGRHRER